MLHPTPRQQNRAMLMAVGLSIGFVLLMCLAIASVMRSRDGLVMVLIVTGIVAVIACGVWLNARRHHRKSIFSPDDMS